MLFFYEKQFKKQFKMQKQTLIYTTYKRENIEEDK